MMMNNLITAILITNSFIVIQNHKCTNEWIVKIEDQTKVESIANATGFLNKGQVRLE